MMVTREYLELVDYQQSWLVNDAVQMAFKFTLTMSGNQLQHHVCGGDKTGTQPGHGTPLRESSGKMAFTYTRGAQEHDVLLSLRTVSLARYSP